AARQCGAILRLPAVLPQTSYRVGEFGMRCKYCPRITDRPQVLCGIETRRRDIAEGSYHLPVATRTESLRTIFDDGNAEIVSALNNRFDVDRCAVKMRDHNGPWRTRFRRYRCIKSLY